MNECTRYRVRTPFSFLFHAPLQLFLCYFSKAKSVLGLC